MAASHHDTWPFDIEEARPVCLERAREHDRFWARAHVRENYFRQDLDYEDYAPAYCVGYIGHAQYGGTFEDSEKSLVSNWLRIKGDSRLNTDEARVAIRAAWARCEARQAASAASDPAFDAESLLQAARRRVRHLLEESTAWKRGALAFLRNRAVNPPDASPAERGSLVR